MLEAQECVDGRGGGIQVHVIIPAGVWVAARGPGGSSVVAGGLGHCSEPGQAAAPCRGATRAKTDLGQAVVTTHVDAPSIQYNFALPVTHCSNCSLNPAVYGILLETNVLRYHSDECGIKSFMEKGFMLRI